MNNIYSKSYNTNFNSNYKNNNTNNNNTFSPASSSRFSSAKGDAPKIQNLTPTYKGREISSLSPSQNTNILNSLDYSTNINHIPKIEEDELASDSSNKGLFYSYKDKPISSNDLNLHFNYDQNESDVFNVKLNESETNLTKKFSKNISNLVTPQNQKGSELNMLSDSDSSSSSYHPKQSTKSFLGDNSVNPRSFSAQNSISKNENDANEKKSIIYLSESETNESDVSSNELNNKVTSYMNQLKYLSSSELETSSTSTTNAIKNKINNMHLSSESETTTEDVLSIKKTTRRQVNSYTAKTNSNSIIDLNFNSDSETMESSTNQNFENLTKGKSSTIKTDLNHSINSNLHLDSDSEISSEESSNKHYESLAVNKNNSYAKRFNHNANSDLHLLSDSEVTSESSLNQNYSTKPPNLQSSRYSNAIDLDSTSESEELPRQEFTSSKSQNVYSNKLHSNSFNSKFNYGNEKSSQMRTGTFNLQSTPIGRNLNQDQDLSSSDAFIETPKFSISRKNEIDISDSSEEINSIADKKSRINFSTTTTPKQYTRFSSPKTSSALNNEGNSTNYSFKGSNKYKFDSRSSTRTPQASSLASFNYKSRNSFISESRNLSNANGNSDSDDEFLETLRQTIKDNEALLRSFGHST